MIWLLVLQLVAWQPVQPPVLHQGTVQVCKDEETALEHRVLGKFEWELHVRAPDEFGIYTYAVAQEHEHDDPVNLLGSAYRVSDVQTWRAKRQWTVPSLRLWISVAEVPTSRTLDETCHAFNIRIEKR